MVRGWNIYMYYVSRWYLVGTRYSVGTYYIHTYIHISTYLSMYHTYMYESVYESESRLVGWSLERWSVGLMRVVLYIWKLLSICSCLSALYCRCMHACMLYEMRDMIWYDMIWSVGEIDRLPGLWGALYVCKCVCIYVYVHVYTVVLWHGMVWYDMRCDAKMMCRYMVCESIYIDIPIQWNTWRFSCFWIMYVSTFFAS